MKTTNQCGIFLRLNAKLRRILHFPSSGGSAAFSILHSAFAVPHSPSRILHFILLAFLSIGCSSPYLSVYTTTPISTVTPYVNINNLYKISNFIVESSGGHNGFDFHATQNMQIRAAAAGTVMDVERRTNTVHNVQQVNIRIRVTDKYTLIYIFEPFTATASEIEAQEAAITIRAGDHVSQGEVIGTLLPYDLEGAHVHYGVKDSGTDVCPETFFGASDVAAMLAVFQTSTGSTENLCVVR